MLTKLLVVADIQIDGPRPWDIQVHDARFFGRVLASSTLGFGLPVRSAVPRVRTTMIRPTILHSSNTGIMAAVVVVVAVADVMDMDKAECSISRILPVRQPRCRDNSNYASLGLLIKIA